MNDNAKKWVAALRSGKYGQCRSRLKLGSNLFCCLGVAENVVLGNRRRSGAHFLSEGSRKALGLRSVTGWFNGQSLAQLNDSGSTFAEIADIIESEPEGLFVDAKARGAA